MEINANNKLPWLGFELKLLRMWVRQQTNWAVDELKVCDNLLLMQLRYSLDVLHNHPMRILHHQPAHAHSTVVAF